MANKGNKELAAAAGSLQRGDLASAEKACAKILADEPGNAGALAMLGDIYLRQGRAAQAAKQYRLALDAYEKSGQAAPAQLPIALAGALQAKGDARAAMALLNEIIEKNGNAADAYFARAGLAWAMGDQPRAIADLKAVVERQPDNIRAVSNLGAALRDAGDIGGAIAIMKPLAEAGAQDAMLMFNYGLALSNAGSDADAAIGYLQRAVALQPDMQDAHIILISEMISASRLEEAERVIAAALKKWADHPAILTYRGSARLAAGDKNAALADLRRALELDPGSVLAHTYLIDAGDDLTDPKPVEQIEAALAKGSLPPHDVAQLHFSAARRCMKMKSDDRAFEHFRRGNEAKQVTMLQRGVKYDPAAMERRTEDLIRGFDRQAFEGPVGSDSDLPVFIVGMPRSGTTLVEQIIASHPRAFGAGELDFMGRAAAGLRASTGYPIDPVPEETLRIIAGDFLALLRQRGGDALRVCDKMPANFQQLGLIAQLFPKARIIHTRRDAMDTCFSCYMQNFRGVANPYIYGQESLAHYYGLYERLMEHWRSVLPVPMLEVDYEAVVADQEAESRKIIDFLGLDWDDACLDFHRAERAVVTSSIAQVRQPIYNSSIGQWRRFEKHLKPLAEKLEEFRGQPPQAGPAPEVSPVKAPAIAKTEGQGMNGNPTLADLLHPVTEEEFFAEYYGKKFLHVEGSAAKFEQVMSWDILARLLNQTAIWTSKSLMLVLDHDILPAAAYCKEITNRDGFDVKQPDAAKVMDLLRRGASLVANDIDSLTPELAGVAAALEAGLSGKAQANLYCSWKQHQAFGSHFDTHDVYAVHVAGEKLWNIYETLEDNPVAHPRFKSYGQAWHDKNRGAVAAQVMMRPGDLLYLPRGLYHDAMATSDGTIHMAFGVTQVIGLDVVDMIKAAGVEDVEFRRNMPRPEEGEAAVAAWLDGLAGRIGDFLRSPAAANAMIQHQKDFRYPRGGIELPVQAAGRRFRVKAAGLSVQQQNGQWLLAGAKGVVPIPAGQEAAVSWILDHPEFTEDQLTTGVPGMDAAKAAGLLEALQGMKVIAVA